jgi:hypothetical protein
VFKIKNLVAEEVLRKVEPIRHRNQRFRRPVEGNIATVMAAVTKPVPEDDSFLQMAGHRREGLEGGEIHWPVTVSQRTAAGQKGWARLLPEGADTPFEKAYCRKSRSPAPILPGFSQSGASLRARNRPTWMGFAVDRDEPRSASGHDFFQCGDGS